MTHGGEEAVFGQIRFFELDVFVLQCLFEPLALSHIARRSEDTLKVARLIVESRRVITDNRFVPVPGTCDQFIVSYSPLAQDRMDAIFGPFRIREVLLEGRADQFVAGVTGED